MSEPTIFPAPEIPIPPENQWRREQKAFRKLLPSLLNTHRGQYVAIHEGQVVESGSDKRGGVPRLRPIWICSDFCQPRDR